MSAGKRDRMENYVLPAIKSLGRGVSGHRHIVDRLRLYGHNRLDPAQAGKGIAIIPGCSGWNTGWFPG